MTETNSYLGLIVLTNGTRHVSIQRGEGERFVALKHVGHSHYPLSTCSARQTFKTEAGARKWAAKMIG